MKTDKTNDIHAINEINDVIDQCGLDQIKDRWSDEGWTLEQIKTCCIDYHELTKEDMSFGEIEEAVYDANDSGGLAPCRQYHFFAGWKKSNDRAIKTTLIK